MKVVLLAGGFGTRISEESYLRPKPMIEIGEIPILVHIMKWYSKFGYNDYIICLGYKQHIIKDYFADYYLHNSDVTFDLEKNIMEMHHNSSEPWKVTLVDTGLKTLTGGRIKRVQKYIGNEPFMLTYGDGVADIDLNQLLEEHKKNKKIVTLTAVQPDGRFGVLDLKGNDILAFREKKKDDMGWINGGYMVVEPEIFDYIDGDMISFEKEPLENVATAGLLGAYKHNGFWHCMDTIRDKEKLDEMWAMGNAPWQV